MAPAIDCPHLQSPLCLTKDGEIETLSAKDLAFGQCHSAIQNSAVVLSAKSALCPGWEPSGYQENGSLTHLRELKQPLEYPSCGSVFNQRRHFWQVTLQKLAWKAIVLVAKWCEKHAGFMINVADGTAKDSPKTWRVWLSKSLWTPRYHAWKRSPYLRWKQVGSFSQKCVAMSWKGGESLMLVKHM